MSPRQVGDPALDAWVAAHGAGIWRLGPQLAAAPNNHDPLPADFTASPLPDLERLPTWADPAALARAAAFGERHLGLIVVCLFAASLPRLFTGAKGAMVLGATGRMTEEMDRRINETGRFVLDVWAPGGFGPTGAAIRSTLRVRVLHAAVRAHLAGRFGDDTPINQEDLLATLFAFSFVVTDALRTLGVPVDPRDADDVWHLWRVIGVLLGIDADLLPVTLASARLEQRRIERAQVGPSAPGQAMAARLLTRMEAHLPLAPGLPRALLTLLLGSRRMAVLALTIAPAPSVAELTALRTAGQLLGRNLLELGVATKLGGRRVDFGAPAQR